MRIDYSCFISMNISLYSLFSTAQLLVETESVLSKPRIELTIIISPNLQTKTLTLQDIISWDNTESKTGSLNCI